MEPADSEAGIAIETHLPCPGARSAPEPAAPRPGRPKGFTLLELLVSIAIIALRASFILVGAVQVMRLVRKIMQMAGR